jgi:AAA+ lid domain
LVIECRVLQALTRKFRLHEDVSLFEVAKRCPPNFTGADMYALCADAWFNAAKRKVFIFFFRFSNVGIKGFVVLVVVVFSNVIVFRKE